MRGKDDYNDDDDNDKLLVIGQCRVTNECTCILCLYTSVNIPTQLLFYPDLKSTLAGVQGHKNARLSLQR